MNDVVDKVNLYLERHTQSHPDIVMPGDDVISAYADDLRTDNPFRIIYQMILEDSLYGSLDAISYSDDGVSVKTSSGLGVLADLLPMYGKLASAADAAKSDSVMHIKEPYDRMNALFEQWGV